MRGAIWAAIAAMMAVSIAMAACVVVQGAPLTCRELVNSYVAADQDPVLMQTTAYIHGEICCRGEKPRRGIVAAAPEWYGMACVIYTVDQDGGIGEQLGIWEVLDTGYGRSTGDGIPSKVRDSDSRGTIETGKCIDVYFPTMAEAEDWMEKTGGRVYAQIIPAEG